MDGIQDVWQYQTRNDIQFNNLPYGTYYLQIKGRNSGGLWTIKDQRIKIIVLRPFYLQNWFVTLAFCLFIVVAIVFARYRTNKYRKDALMLQEKIRQATMRLS